MADPLATLAEREVPAPTNFFDPAGARDIIARYSNSRRNAADSGAALERVSKVQDDEARLRMNEARAKREEIMFDREDQDYAARKQALASQGEFLTSLNDIDPTAEDYDERITEFMTGLPPELHDEPAVKAIFTFKNSVADDARRRRDAEFAKKQTVENQLATIRERAKLGMSYDLKDEDVKAATREDGTVDEFKLGTIAGANRRRDKASEFDRRLEAVNSGRIKVIQAADLSRKGRERRSTVDKYIIEDRAAFPRRADAVAEAYKSATGKPSVDLKILEVNPKWRDQVAAAKAWDSKPLDSELSAAFAYEDPETYVNLVKGLNDSQKDRRRMVWEHAHKDGAVEETDAPSGSDVPEEKGADRSPPAATKKPLTPDVIADIKRRAGGDPAKAKQLAIDEGY